ncbi:MAG TPA: CcmD family protein [Flavisolibacter sp.]|nr:CcmD family protein [Flavisolibacter sp.]
MRKSIASLFLLLLQLNLKAQEGGVTMADEMRNNGKIYVVVAVILAIFIGIILYIVRLDRKITRLEKDQKSNTLITKS